MKKHKKLKDLLDKISLLLLQLSYFVVEADHNDNAINLLEHISDLQVEMFNVINEKE